MLTIIEPNAKSDLFLNKKLSNTLLFDIILHPLFEQNIEPQTQVIAILKTKRNI